MVVNIHEAKTHFSRLIGPVMETWVGSHGKEARRGPLRQSLVPAPPIRPMERLSDAYARMRKLKRDWTADLFTKQGQFWEQIRARRNSFGITPRMQVPPGKLDPRD